jgi:hypothetical protein
MIWALVEFYWLWKEAAKTKLKADIIVLSEEYYFEPNWFVLLPVIFFTLAGLICLVMSFQRGSATASH